MVYPSILNKLSTQGKLYFVLEIKKEKLKHTNTMSLAIFSNGWNNKEKIYQKELCVSFGVELDKM